MTDYKHYIHHHNLLGKAASSYKYPRIPFCNTILIVLVLLPQSLDTHYSLLPASSMAHALALIAP